MLHAFNFYSSKFKAKAVQTIKMFKVKFGSKTFCLRCCIQDQLKTKMPNSRLCCPLTWREWVVCLERPSWTWSTELINWWCWRMPEAKSVKFRLLPAVNIVFVVNWSVHYIDTHPGTLVLISRLKCYHGMYICHRASYVTETCFLTKPHAN